MISAVDQIRGVGCLMVSFSTFAAKPNFPCIPSLGRTFTEVPAGYLLWCRCTAQLHYWVMSILVNGTYRCTLIYEITWQWQRTC